VKLDAFLGLPWPKYPHYNGQGNPKKASSFTCRAPA